MRYEIYMSGHPVTPQPDFTGQWQRFSTPSVTTPSHPVNFKPRDAVVA